jgi:hypothetical protein
LGDFRAPFYPNAILLESPMMGKTSGKTYPVNAFPDQIY